MFLRCFSLYVALKNWKELWHFEVGVFTAQIVAVSLRMGSIFLCIVYLKLALMSFLLLSDVYFVALPHPQSSTFLLSSPEFNVSESIDFPAEAFEQTGASKETQLPSKNFSCILSF